MIKILSKKQIQKEIGFMVDADPEYVSIVRHGANQQPFRVVKNDEGGRMKIIQSLILPSGNTLDSLIGTPGLEYLVDAKKDTVKKGDEYQSYEQIPATDMENFQVLKAGAGWLVVGTLKDGKKADNVLTLSDEQVQKLDQLPIPEALADDTWVQQYGPTFMDSVNREVYAMLDIIRGHLMQATADSKTRRKMVMAAIDTFRAFMAVAVDALGNGATASTTKIDEILSRKQKQGGDTMDLFKDEAEFMQKVGDVVTQTLEKFQTRLVEKFDLKEKSAETPKPAVPEKKETEEVKTVQKTEPPEVDLKPLMDKIEALGTQVKDMKEKFDNQLATEPTPQSEEIVDIQTEPDEKNPFRGFLVKSPKVAA